MALENENTEEKEVVEENDRVNEATDEVSDESKDEVIDESIKEKNNEATEEVEEVEVVSSIEEKLRKKENEASDYLNTLQRTMAEFDNFRKRTIKEKTQMYENGAKEVLEKLLPVIDNFERALQSINEEEKNNGIAQGVDMIYKQLIGALKEIGAEEIDAMGNAFDPNLHNAVAHETNEEYGENEVIEVLQKGYIYKDRVLRHSMVRVAN